jgi:branched-chain amino acid transport system substrate-binding protein
MKNTRRKAAAALAASALLLLTACGQAPGSAPSADGEPIVLGQIASLNGVLATVGSSQVRGLAMGIEAVNAQGGIDGRPVKVIVQDDGSDTTQPRVLAERLIEADGADMILGPATTPQATALLPLLAAQQVAGLSTVSADSVLAPEKAPYYFSISPSTSQQALAQVQIISQLGAKRVGALVDTSDFANDMLATLKKQGVDVVELQRFAVGDADFTAQMAALGRAGVDAVLINSNGVDTTRIITARNAAGLGFAIVGTSNTLNPSYLAEIGQAGSKNVYGPITKALTYPSGGKPPADVSRIVDQLGADADKLNLSQVLNWYDVAFILKAAYERGHSFAGADFAAAMAGLTYDGVYAHYSWAADRHFGILADALTGAQLTDCSAGACAVR